MNNSWLENVMYYFVNYVKYFLPCILNELLFPQWSYMKCVHVLCAAKILSFANSNSQSAGQMFFVVWICMEVWNSKYRLLTSVCRCILTIFYTLPPYLKQFFKQNFQIFRSSVFSCRALALSIRKGRKSMRILRRHKIRCREGANFEFEWRS